MKSMTIHGIDDALARRIKSVSRKRGKSVNMTLKEILSGYLGLSGVKKEPDYSVDFGVFFGKWSKEDSSKLMSHLSDTRQIEKEDWN